MNSPEFQTSNEHSTVEPAIQCMINSMLEKYAPQLNASDAEKYRQMSDEGDRIDLVCFSLGWAQNIEASTKLKALRLVRTFSRQIHGEPISERDFDFPILPGTNHTYWRHVDEYFMQFIELQARNNHGTYLGEPDYKLDNGRADYTPIASLLQTDVYKSAILHQSEPIHVYYRAERAE